MKRNERGGGGGAGGGAGGEKGRRGARGRGRVEVASHASCTFCTPAESRGVFYTQGESRGSEIYFPRRKV